jgi:hypothetical protein
VDGSGNNDDGTDGRGCCAGFGTGSEGSGFSGGLAFGGGNGGAGSPEVWVSSAGFSETSIGALHLGHRTRFPITLSGTFNSAPHPHFTLIASSYQLAAILPRITGMIKSTR